MAEELLSNTLANDGKEVVVKGSCLCGAIKYTIEGSPSTTVLCHCISCKKQSGSAFKANSIYSISVRKLESPFSLLPFPCHVGKPEEEIEAS